MAFIDKRNILPTIGAALPVVLELGCGDRRRVPHSIGIDILDYEAVDIVGDVFEVLEAFPCDSVRSVHAHHVIEHIPDLARLMDILGRIVRPGGTLNFVVPHFSNPYYHSDATHKTPFGLYTFSYLSADNIHKRRTPTYQREMRFELVRAELNFKSNVPFYGRHGIKKVFGFFFNLNRATREFYEENLCYLFPCYELNFQLRRIEDHPITA